MTLSLIPIHINPVTLNSFQGPSSPHAPTAQSEEWMLKQVQHDDGREVAQ